MTRPPIVILPMNDELLRTGGWGVAAVLLGFELVAAVRSWFAARGRRRARSTPWLGDIEHGPLLLSQGSVIRGHLRDRQAVVNALRQQYPALGTTRRARELRTAIERLRVSSFNVPGGRCPGCRLARFKGHAHCPECRRRLVVPAVPAGN